MKLIEHTNKLCCLWLESVILTMEILRGEMYLDSMALEAEIKNNLSNSDSPMIS